MWWVDQIYSIIWNISTWFLNTAQAIPSWIDIGGWLSTPFYALASLFWNWLTPIAHFGDWADDVWARVQKILTEEGILGLIKWWFPWLEDIGIWFAARLDWALTTIGNWWSVVALQVQGWIEVATQALQALIDNLTTWLAYLQVTWDTFITVTLPTLITTLDAQNLMDSTLRSWFPFYDDLINIWNEIVEFFADPLDWVYKKMDEFFERFW